PTPERSFFVESSQVNGMQYGVGISGHIHVTVTGHGRGSVGDPGVGYTVEHPVLNYGRGISGALAPNASSSSQVVSSSRPAQRQRQQPRLR
ncbi:unnamed protein product, partial [Polarella glacialis]